MKSSLVLVLACGALLLAPAVARASMLGSEVTVEWIWPFSSSIDTHTFVVGPSVELPFGSIQPDSDLSLDVGDDFIVLSPQNNAQWQDTPANGWRLSDSAGVLPEIVGFQIGAVSGDVSGLDAEDLQFDGDWTFANFGASGPGGAVIWSAGSSIRLDIVFAPEPSSACLLAAGLLALAARRRHHPHYGPPARRG